MTRRYAWSYLIAVGLTALIGLVGSITDSSFLGALLFPGAVLAMIAFGSIHDNHVIALFVTTYLVDAFLFSWLVLFLWNKVLSPRGRSSKSDTDKAIQN